MADLPAGGPPDMGQSHEQDRVIGHPQEPRDPRRVGLAKRRLKDRPVGQNADDDREQPRSPPARPGPATAGDRPGQELQDEAERDDVEYPQDRRQPRPGIRRIRPRCRTFDVDVFSFAERIDREIGPLIPHEPKGRDQKAEIDHRDEPPARHRKFVGAACHGPGSASRDRVAGRW